MSKTITQEITEFRAAIDAYDGTSPRAGIRLIISEGFDVLGKVKNLGDDPGVISEVTDAISDATISLAGKLLANKPFVRNGAKVGISFMVPTLVTEAAKYTGTVDQFWDEKIEPVLAELEAVIHEIRTDMA